ncbi:MAG: hypothetical protein J7647_22190 [Cyanobacteria bacterium SBLK]|nr:hypothetical protein [Cyanobacteria bacterium SBLK]
MGSIPAVVFAFERAIAPIISPNFTLIGNREVSLWEVKDSAIAHSPPTLNCQLSTVNYQLSTIFANRLA